MKILAHRGFWTETSEKNSINAFSRAFLNGFGIETDLRDICGNIVISHDCPNGNEILFEDVLKLLDGRNLTLALNIKADGLAKAMLSLLEKYKVSNFFTFDMSIPEMYFQSGVNISYFSGISDISPSAVLYKSSLGIWLDAFDNLWYDNNKLYQLLETIIERDEKKVCIVSEDLHNRCIETQWDMIRSLKFVYSDSLYLCTDKPLEAREFFNV